MCGFCETGFDNRILGEYFKINHWAYKTDLKKARIISHPSCGSPCVVIRSSRTTRGSFFINYCPMCGRDLRGNSENE